MNVCVHHIINGPKGFHHLETDCIQYVYIEQQTNLLGIILLCYMMQVLRPTAVFFKVVIV